MFKRNKTESHKEYICNNPDHDHGNYHRDQHHNDHYYNGHHLTDAEYDEFIKTRDYYGPDRRQNKLDNSKNYLISILILVITNIGAAIWWASGITEDIRTLKSRPELSERVIKMEASVEMYNKYFARLDATLDALNDVVSEIDKEQTRNSYIIDKLEKNKHTHNTENPKE